MASKCSIFDIYECIARDLIKEMWFGVVKVRTSNPWKIYAEARKTCPSVSAYAIIDREVCFVNFASSQLENKDEYVCFFFIKEIGTTFWADAMELAKKEEERQKRKEAKNAN